MLFPRRQNCSESVNMKTQKAFDWDIEVQIEAEEFSFLI
jgi:hypothetical protein